MNKHRKLNAFTCIFLLCMLIFTLFSEDLYNMTLPKVLTGKVKDKAFPLIVIKEDGTQFNTTMKMNAVPKVATRGNSVFILEEREDGLYAAAKEIVTGEEHNGWISIEQGVSSRDKIIIGADRKLEPGMKVMEVSENVKKK